MTVSKRACSSSLVTAKWLHYLLPRIINLEWSHQLRVSQHTPDTIVDKHWCLKISCVSQQVDAHTPTIKSQDATSVLTQALAEAICLQFHKNLLGTSNGNDRWHQLSYMVHIYIAGNNIIYTPEGQMKLKSFSGLSLK